MRPGVLPAPVGMNTLRGRSRARVPVREDLRRPAGVPAPGRRRPLADGPGGLPARARPGWPARPLRTGRAHRRAHLRCARTGATRAMADRDENGSQRVTLVLAIVRKRPLTW
ncbi:MAG: hypothetical protein KatS3mg010_1693 [Acidimicrobiia bacterium]|nr:MAG: hypothetical protein KatS3mg010_1693 [Acidimicrobiia bacterium]